MKITIRLEVKNAAYHSDDSSNELEVSEMVRVDFRGCNVKRRKKKKEKKRDKRRRDLVTIITREH